MFMSPKESVAWENIILMVITSHSCGIFNSLSYFFSSKFSLGLLVRFPNDLFPECPLDSVTVLLVWWNWSMRSDTCLFTDLSIHFPASMGVSRRVYNDTHSGKLQMFLLICFVTSSFFSPGKFSHVSLHELIFPPLFSKNTYFYTLNSLRTRICWIFIHSGWKAVS